MRTFTQQVDRLVELGYPGLAGRSEKDLRALLAPLEASVPVVDGDSGPGEAPYVVVLTREVVDPYATVPLLRLAGGGKAGIVDRNHSEGDLATYDPLPELGVPAGPAYLLVGVERGEEFCGVRPEDALPVIRERGRSPLTIDEGIAVVTQAPELLEKNRCFMLSGSRRSDRRVPAL